MQNKVELALPRLEDRLQEVRILWRRQRQGELVPDAQDAVFLTHVLLAGLDIAVDANISLERWKACLMLLAESEEIMRASGQGDHEFAGIRFRRYGPLLRLGRPDEAQQTLESCLNFWQKTGDFLQQANALSALADLWKLRGDQRKAVGLERRALDLHNRLEDLVARSKSHGNLAVYLDGIGAAEEAARHLLAAIGYDLVTGHNECLSIHLRNLAILTFGAGDIGARFELPRLTALLGRPDFEPFRRTLAVWPVAAADIQERVDALVELVRRGAEGLPK